MELLSREEIVSLREMLSMDVNVEDADFAREIIRIRAEGNITNILKIYDDLERDAYEKNVNDFIIPWHIYMDAAKEIKNNKNA